MPVLNRPNILLFLFDSLSAIDGGFQQTSIKTPRLANLCDEGTQFANTYTPCPESSPARASLFTGLDPCVHGLWTNGVSLPRHVQTLPEILAQAGYTNWLVGRRQLAGVANWTTEHPRSHEFAHVDWAHGPLHRSRQNAYLAWLQQSAPERYARIFATQADPDETDIPPQQRAEMSKLPDDLSFNHWVGERVVQLVAAHPPDHPFFAVAGFSVGSSLGGAPSLGHDGEGLCERALRQADAAAGRILDQLAARNRANDTTVFVTSARGNACQEGRSTPMSEVSIRVPLLMRHEGLERHVIEAPVSTMDVAPTVLEIAGIPVGSRMQGESLLGVLGRSHLPRGWAMCRLRRGPPHQGRNWQTALRARNMKLVVEHGLPQDCVPATYRLFDLAADPGECNDLAGRETHAADLEDMIDQMIDARCALENRTEPRIAEF